MHYYRRHGRRHTRHYHIPRKRTRLPHSRTIVHIVYPGSSNGWLVRNIALHGALIEVTFSELIRPGTAPVLATKAERGGTRGTPANRREISNK